MKDPAHRWGTAALLLAVLLVTACTRRSSSGDPWSLYRGLVGSGRVEVMLPAARDPEAWRWAETRIRRAAIRLNASGAQTARVLEPGDPGDPGAARVLVAEAATPQAAPLLAALGVSLEEGGFRYAGRRFEGPTAVLIATFEDPARPGLPVTLYFGNSAAAAGRYLRDLTPTWRSGVRCFRSGGLALEGRLFPDGSLDRGTRRDVDQERHALAQRRIRERRGSLGLALPGDLDAAARDAYLQAAEVARQRALDVLHRPASGPAPATPRLHLYAELEDKVLETGSWELFSLEPLTGEPHTLLAPGLFDDGGAGVACATALVVAGPPAQDWLLEGLGVHAAGSWCGRPLDGWVASLRGATLVPAPEVFLAPAAGLSPHIRAPLRGAFLGFLLNSEGADVVRELWLGKRQLELTPALIGAFGDWVERTWEDGGPALAARAAERRERILARALRKGIALTVAPGQADPRRRGYGTRSAREGLAAARELGADAFSLTAFATVVPGLPVFAGDGPRRHCETSSDLALAASVAAGRELGMSALLAPQLLENLSGTWVGLKGISGLEGWGAFFDTYERFAVHYALLAELSDAEIFCFGSGAPLSTYTGQGGAIAPSEQPYLAWKLARWRELIGRLHRAFSGLTYGATWAGQVQQIEFWDDLDFVCVQLLGPLCDRKNPERRLNPLELSRLVGHGLGAVMEKAEQHGKRALFVQLGVPATAGGLVAPWAGPGPADAGPRERYFQALESGLDEALASHPDPAGLYLWSWNTDPRGPGPRGRLFSLRDGSCEELLRRLYSRR